MSSMRYDFHGMMKMPRAALVLAALVLAAFLLTMAYRRLIHGPTYDPAWIESQSVYGIRLGDDIDEAVAKLRLRRKVDNFGPKADPRVPWTRLYWVENLSTKGLSTNDLALLRQQDKSEGPGPALKGFGSPNLALYGSVGKNAGKVTAITLIFKDKVDHRRLGTPTEIFQGSGPFSKAYTVFAAERGLDAPYLIQAMDTCAGIQYAKNFKAAYHAHKRLRCKTAIAAKQPYLFITYKEPTGFSEIELRDPRGLSNLPKGQ